MPDDKNLAKRSVHAAGWVLIVKFASQFIQLFLGILMARLLSPNDFGVLGVLAVFWSVCNVFIDGGFGQALLQRKEIDDLDLSTVFYYNLFLSLLCCGAMILAAPYIAEFYHRPILNETIKVSAWALPIAALTATQNVILSRKLKQAFITLSRLCAIVLSGICALLLAWKGYGVWALVWQNFLAACFTSLFVFLFVRWVPRFRFSFKALKSFFKYGSNLMLVNLIDQVFTHLHSIFIGKFYPIETLGVYERARTYASIWPQSIQGSISQVLFPAFSKIQDDLGRLRNAFRRSLSLSVCIIVFPSYLLCVLCKPFILLILTPKWLPCIPYWWLLTFTIFLWPIHVLNLQVIKALGRSDVTLYLELIKKGLLIGQIAILVFWGLIPMLSAGIFCSFINVYLNSWYSGKMLNFGLGNQIKTAFPYIGLAVVSCTAAWGLYRFLTPISAWLGFILPAIAGTALYILLNILFKTDAVRDLKSVLGSGSSAEQPANQPEK